MLSTKEQENYIDSLTDQNNLVPISKHVKKRTYDLLHNHIDLNILVKELEKPLSDLNMHDLENSILVLYLALINPKRYRLSKKKVKEIPGKILQLIDYGREKIRLQESTEKKDKPYNRRKTVKFFTGILICMRYYLQNNQKLIDI